MADHYADPVDRASAETDAHLADRVDEQLRRARASTPPPTADGTCACGCGEEVEPARLALGYGLALGCAERADARRRNHR